MTPSGIEPATFRFVAQRLNYCASGRVKVYIIYNYVTLWYIIDNHKTTNPEGGIPSGSCESLVNPGPEKNISYFLLYA